MVSRHKVNLSGPLFHKVFYCVGVITNVKTWLGGLNEKVVA